MYIKSQRPVDFENIHYGDVFYSTNLPSVIYIRTDNGFWVATDLRSGKLCTRKSFSENDKFIIYNVEFQEVETLIAQEGV